MPDFKLDLTNGRVNSTNFYGYRFNGSAAVTVDDPAIVEKLEKSPLFLRVKGSGKSKSEPKKPKSSWSQRKKMG
jgi:hypothetical protein